jgi:hypothetical protein
VRCKYRTNKGKQHVQQFVYRIPLRFGARPHSFDLPWSRPRSRPRFWAPTTTGARERAGQVSPPRFPSSPPLSTLTHRTCERGTTQDDAGTSPPLLSCPTSSTRTTGGHTGRFPPPPPPYTPAPTYAQTGTQTQDDAGRCGDKPPPPPFAPASSTRRQGAVKEGLPPSRPHSRARENAQGTPHPFFSLLPPLTLSTLTRTPCARAGVRSTPAIATATTPRPLW